MYKYTKHALPRQTPPLDHRNKAEAPIPVRFMYLGVCPNIAANASPKEKILCLSSAGNIISVLHCYTLGLFKISSCLVLLLDVVLPYD